MKRKALKKGALFGLVPMASMDVIFPMVQPLNSIAYQTILDYGMICGIIFGIIGYELFLKDE